ncbi:MAG TPA: hypothetical protein VGN07_10385 [Steroidobacteraceae bacterium]|jgi:hypothetical protein
MRLCQEQFVTLISSRAEAIAAAFGDLSGTMPPQIRVVFARSGDDDYVRFDGSIAYDKQRQLLIFPRRVLYARLPNPLQWAFYYWPFYQEIRFRQAFPVIEAVDDVLWSAYLQEAAKVSGLAWPHQNCSSTDIGKRLPCEMTLKGIEEHIKSRSNRIFNSNRVDRIWPEDFTDFRRHVWHLDDPEYLDVELYGGILLVRPLINEFGAARAFAYVAQNPFEMEANNLRASALRYQERAREVLSLKQAASPAVAPGPPASAVIYFPSQADRAQDKPAAPAQQEGALATEPVGTGEPEKPTNE